MSARAKPPAPTRRSRRPSVPAADDAEQLTSGSRIKRAAIDPASREAIDASIDAALRDLDTLEAVTPAKKRPGRRVPPFPGTGLTQAVPPLPSLRPTRSSRPKKRGP